MQRRLGFDGPRRDDSDRLVSAMVQILERLPHSTAERGATLTALANSADLLSALPDQQ